MKEMNGNKPQKIRLHFITARQAQAGFYRIANITWAAAKRSRPPDIGRGSTVLPPTARRIVRAGRVLQRANEGVYDCTRPK